MATKVALPLPNVDYTLSLGGSFVHDAGEDVGTSYAALRYDFRPASADLEQPGVLVLGKDNRVSLYLANSATCELDVLLSGKYEPYAGGGQPSSMSQGRDCLDCVAIFDPATSAFRLETLLGQYNTKHVRDAPPYRPPVEDLTELSPGTSGSAGPGASMSPPVGRRSDSHRGSDDCAQPSGQLQQQQTHAGQAHDRYGSGGAAAAAARNSKPPRPPRVVSAGRAASGAQGAQGKKRQRDAGTEKTGSPAGAPAKKTSRLARSSGPRAQEQGQVQAKRGGTNPEALQKQGTTQALPKCYGDAVTASPAEAVPEPGDRDEEDVDAALLDAFDTFDTFDGGVEDGITAPAADGAMDDGGCKGVGNGTATAPEPAPAEFVLPAPITAPVIATAIFHDGESDVGAEDVPPLMAAGLHASAPTPSLEVAAQEEEGEEMVEEELQQHHQYDGHQNHQEPEEVVPSPPGARLVVDMVDDDDGYGYGADEEEDLGIEYF
ncbi:hypothetical protein Vretifemale_6786 [Volvox reticuliferus]|uniref:Transcription elongation factor Eaf N-terminal domain-containing protein n=1 Tax=Volvox reticuliferus TaxID=1737510 RepID=A0A8J4C9F6_9CHLO|nr:hypothetical protein Vretifemale_6786 [Volvox reticuliferus]